MHRTSANTRQVISAAEDVPSTTHASVTAHASDWPSWHDQSAATSHAQPRAGLLGQWRSARPHADVRAAQWDRTRSSDDFAGGSLHATLGGVRHECQQRMLHTPAVPPRLVEAAQRNAALWQGAAVLDEEGAEAFAVLLRMMRGANVAGSTVADCRGMTPTVMLSIRKARVGVFAHMHGTRGEV